MFNMFILQFWQDRFTLYQRDNINEAMIKFNIVHFNVVI